MRSLLPPATVGTVNSTGLSGRQAGWPWAMDAVKASNSVAGSLRIFHVKISPISVGRLSAIPTRPTSRLRAPD